MFRRPVVTAPASVRRDGMVLAAAAGRLKPRQRRRIMSYPLVIRLMLAMTLVPAASYGESLAASRGCSWTFRSLPPRSKVSGVRDCGGGVRLRVGFA